MNFNKMCGWRYNVFHIISNKTWRFAPHRTLRQVNKAFSNVRIFLDTFITGPRWFAFRKYDNFNSKTCIFLKTVVNI